MRTIAPFLRLDQDPYLVISEGRLYWMQDAYTTSRWFPYSKRLPNGRANYIRNSVKIVIDAYNGTVDFYVADPLRRDRHDLPAHLPRTVQAVRGQTSSCTGPFRSRPHQPEHRDLPADLPLESNGLEGHSR